MANAYNVKEKDVKKFTDGHWLSWSRHVRFSFMEAGLSGYLDGSIEEPTDARELAKWKLTNSRIVGTLGRNVDECLTRELEPDMKANEAWDLLKKCTHRGGVVAKLNAIRSAFELKFSPSTPITTTISEIHDLLDIVFEDGKSPTQSELSIIFMLHALEGTEFDWVQKNLVAQFSNPETTPEEADVIKAISFAGYEKRHQTAENANVFRSSKDSSSKNKRR